MQKVDFYPLISIVAESQGWRPLSDALKDLWLQTANRMPDDQVMALAMSFADTPGQKPADFFKELKSTVRRHMVETAAREPQVIPAPGSAEAIRARRAIAVVQRVKREGCPYGGCKPGKEPGQCHCYCFAEAWAEPITAEERDSGPVANPVAAVFGQAPPDPKELDVVWVDA
jgi:hypothetical protein